MTSPADPGLQSERTALAWRRTALSVTVGSLAGLRVLPPRLGALGYAVSVLGLLWGLDLALTVRRRHRDGSRMLGAGGSESTTAASTTAGLAVARTAALCGLLGVAALVAVVVLATR